MAFLSGYGAGCGCGPNAGPVVGGGYTNTGTILVLFILLVIIARSFWQD